jgi:hypothetical protein
VEANLSTEMSYQAYEAARARARAEITANCERARRVRGLDRGPTSAASASELIARAVSPVLPDSPAWSPADHARASYQVTGTERAGRWAQHALYSNDE